MKIAVLGKTVKDVQDGAPLQFQAVRTVNEITNGTVEADMVLVDAQWFKSIQLHIEHREPSRHIRMVEALETLRRSNRMAREILSSD